MNYRINENLCQAKLSIIRRISDLALENKQPDERVVFFLIGVAGGVGIAGVLGKKNKNKHKD